MREIKVDTVFIGSCTNARIEDLRAAASVLEGRMAAPGLRALVVPGSGQVKIQAEKEGLDNIFMSAGFEWRNPGCSMCLAMNPDKLVSRRTLRLYFQPKFRRPPRAGWSHPSGVTRRRRSHRCRRAFRFPGGSSMKPIRVITGKAVPLDRSKRRHRPDNPGIVAEAGRKDGVRAGAVLRVARPTGLRPQQT